MGEVVRKELQALTHGLRGRGHRRNGRALQKKVNGRGNTLHDAGYSRVPRPRDRTWSLLDIIWVYGLGAEYAVARLEDTIATLRLALPRELQQARR